MTTEISKPGKGITFGISRNMSKRFIEGHFVPDPSTPGPGTYPMSPKFGREGRVIKITGKKTEPKIKNLSPGPGAYDQKWELKKGCYVLSNYKNQEVHKFPPLSFPRFPKLNLTKAPEPGSYEVDKGFLKNSEILSTVKSSGSRKFSTSARAYFACKNESPGPGSYRLPSEFGYYESPKIDGTMSASDLHK